MNEEITDEEPKKYVYATAYEKIIWDIEDFEEEKGEYPNKLLIHSILGKELVEILKEQKILGEQGSTYVWKGYDIEIYFVDIDRDGLHLMSNNYVKEYSLSNYNKIIDLIEPEGIDNPDNFCSICFRPKSSGLLLKHWEADNKEQYICYACLKYAIKNIEFVLDLK